VDAVNAHTAATPHATLDSMTVVEEMRRTFRNRQDLINKRNFPR
jgi:hypothetical protein